MAEKTPIKSENGNLTNFVNKDTIATKHGGTGQNSFPHAGFLYGDGIKKVTSVKLNLHAIRDPKKSDDIHEGYSVGSRWINQQTEVEWLCIDKKYKDAVWISCCGTGGGDDTFRHWMSLIDFKYDYQSFEWEDRECEDFKDVGKITFRYGGDPPSTGEIVGEYEIFYNYQFQPVLARMTYGDSSTKAISFSYDEDEYLTESVRIT